MTIFRRSRFMSRTRSARGPRSNYQDLSGQAKSVYCAFLHLANVIWKAEPTLLQTFLLDGKLRQAQSELTVLKGKLESSKVARAKAAKDAEDAGSEILRLFERETKLTSQVAKS
ncbi:hypothetical protein AHAS_Ahas07G0172000 [Arachis hypogaea]